MASNLETTSGPSMSCQAFLPGPLDGAEAEDLASLPWSFDSSEECEEHEESLTMFCLDDLEPLCKQCAAVSHAGHRVYLLTEAATDCKEELKTSLNGLRWKMSHIEGVINTCEHVSNYNQSEAQLTEAHIKKEFESLHQFLREEEAARLLALREEGEEKMREAGDRIDRLNQAIKSLEDKIWLVEGELDAGGNGAEFLEHYDDMMNSAQTDSREPQEVCRPLTDVAKHLGNLQYAVWEKMKHIAPYTPVTLDPRTASRYIRLSAELNKAHITPKPSKRLGQSLDVTIPDNPERFHPYSCVVAREGFDSGLHSWVVEVGDTSNWTVGVAAQSLSRRTKFEACPDSGLWCIALRDGNYRALTTPSQALDLDDHLSRFRLTLDWDEGTLTFVNADTETHVFTFTQRFTEKVYPYFETVSACGGLAVSEKSVSISLGSDHVSEEDEEDLVMKDDKTHTGGDINSASTNCKKPESESVTADKSSADCSVSENKTKPQRRSAKAQLIKTKPTGKEKTKDGRSAVKKQPRFNVTYHVSLNRALNIISTESGNHKPIQTNHVDHSCDK